MIYKSHEEKIPAPFVATFSARGPNPGSKLVLKVLTIASIQTFYRGWSFSIRIMQSIIQSENKVLAFQVVTRVTSHIVKRVTSPTLFLFPTKIFC